jgi:hypothetical protein
MEELMALESKNKLYNDLYAVLKTPEKKEETTLSVTVNFKTAGDKARFADFARRNHYSVTDSSFRKGSSVFRPDAYLLLVAKSMEVNKKTVYAYAGKLLSLIDAYNGIYELGSVSER